ncbi:MAG TPA: hypothetical protein PKX92_00755 [Edaphocola sp.]|nr:hypothetical protein [Edaphocola sp.]
MKQSFISFFIVAVLLTSCNKKDNNPDYPNIPDIEFLNMSDSMLNLKVDTGKWFLNFEFVDGDGDLGKDPNMAQMSVFLRNEVTLDSFKFPFPYIPDFARQGKDYVKGNASVALQIPLFMKPRTEPAGRTKDTFSFSLYIVDDGGNISDTIYTPNVYISQ